MHTKILTLILALGFTLSLASNNTPTQVISESKIKKMDRKLTKHKAVKRKFHTNKEFKKRSKQHTTYKKSRHNDSYYNGNNYNRSGYRHDNRAQRQRGYRHSLRGWVLAYTYDRASFYDNQGYYYGYFNRYGYYFEDVFYRYDRYYSYRDRVKGRGLFDRRFYMPANTEYYGFSQNTHQYSGYDSRSIERNHERGYDRY